MNTGDWIESFIRGLVGLLAILGNNWLAIRSFPSRLSQIQTNDALFINLAASNLVANYFAGLPVTVADFADGWFAGRSYCGVFLFCSDLSFTSGIFSMLLIGVLWQQKTAASLRYGPEPVPLDSLRLAGALLAWGWGAALAFCAPRFFFVAAGDAGNGSLADCGGSSLPPAAVRTYELLYLALANGAPLAGAVFSAVLIVVTILRHRARVAAADSENPRPGKEGHSGSGSRGGNEDGVDAQGAVNAPGRLLVPGNDGPQPPDAQLAHFSQEGPKEAPPLPSEAATSHGDLVRTAKSVVVAAGVFLICWVTHVLLRVSGGADASSILVKVAGYIPGAYTLLTPYILLFGVKKLSCRR